MGTTYELTFYNLKREFDSVQIYFDKDEAREVMQMFNEPESKEVYSYIQLIEIDRNGTDIKETMIDELIF